MVDNLNDIISSLPKASNLIPILSVLDTSISLTPLNNVDTSPLISNVIPQSLVCNFFYQKVFHNSEEYKKHDSIQFCRDDCGICYATKKETDLHVLLVHTDETNARNFISEATKRLFAQQKSAAM